MSTVLIIYFSKTGNTEKMAHLVAEGVKAEGVEPVLKKVGTASVDELLNADGVIFGSPTYFGTMAAEIKSFLDESVKHFGKLNGKAGAGFSSSALLGGGNETTVLDILKALLIHGMIIQVLRRVVTMALLPLVLLMNPAAKGARNWDRELPVWLRN